MSLKSWFGGASNPAAVPVVRFRLRVFASSSLVAVGILVAFAAPAYCYTLTDNYFGGTNTYNDPADVIGTQTFDITSAVVTRSGINNNTLNVTINTWYAGAPGTTAADGTGYGSLFLSAPGAAWTPTGSAPYSTDTFATNPQWQYAVTMPTSPGTTTGTSGLYSLGTGLNPNLYPGSGVIQSYTTSTGQIVMSNVGGNPITAPASGNPGFYFRQGQAVQFNPNDPSSTVASASWSITPSVGYTTEGSISFSIVDNGFFGNSFALAYAMTCANDVIQGPVSLTTNDITPRISTTPLPAALPLFAGGLGVVGWLARRKKRKAEPA